MKYGVELEGGWRDRPHSPIGEWHEDGSVECDGYECVGEFVTIGGRSREIVREFIWDNYPDGVNETCGMHVHVSFQTLLQYSRMMDPLFPRLLLSRLREWGEERKIFSGSPFWSRLNGENSYCALRYRADQQVSEESTVRYTAVNYCWNAHRTVEVRVLPMFKKLSLGQEAFDVVANAVKEWLARFSRRDEPILVEQAMPAEEPDNTRQEIGLLSRPILYRF